MATASTKDVTLHKLSGVKVTVRVHIARELRFRMWLGARLIALASRVMGTDVAFIDAQAEPPES
jgi:hypothetical protein